MTFQNSFLEIKAILHRVIETERHQTEAVKGHLEEHLLVEKGAEISILEDPQLQGSQKVFD